MKTMEQIFLTVLNMSAAACVVIAVVLLARLLLRRAPKKWSYLLWSVAAFRLCCPVSIKTVFSVFRLTPFREATQMGSAPVTVYGPAAVEPAVVVPVTPASPVTPAVPVAPAVPAPAGPGLLTVLAWMWVLGMAVMIGYSIYSYIKMRRLVSDAVLVRDNLYETDHIRTPFILGLWKPHIYIPALLRGNRLDCVLAHEEYHLRRGDHAIKLLAFGLLAVHWFNPLAWLAFQLMGKDMEMSCDEKVLSTREGKNKDYSEALLSFAAPVRFPAATPLCFGESSVRSRIKNALRWRKPRAWVTALAAMLCVVVLAACAADPAEGRQSEGQPEQQTQTEQQPVTQDMPVKLEALVNRDLPVQITDLGGGKFHLEDAGDTPGLDLTVTLPADWAGRYGVETAGRRLRIYSQASRDAMGFGGWLCCIHVEPGFYPLDYDNFQLESVRVLAATEGYTVLLNGPAGQQYTGASEDKYRTLYKQLGRVDVTLSDWLAQNSWNEANWMEGTVTLYERDRNEPGQYSRVYVCDREISRTIRGIIEGRYGAMYEDPQACSRDAERIDVEILVNGQRSYLLADNGSGTGNYWPAYGAMDSRPLTAEEIVFIYDVLNGNVFGGTVTGPSA